MALPYEEGDAALAARAALLERLREGIGPPRRSETGGRPRRNTDPAALPPRARASAPPSPTGAPPGDGLVLLRSAGERGEAEAIAVEVAKLIAAGADPAADRDRPARPGAARPADRRGARVLRHRRPRSRPRCRSPAPRSAATLIALLEAEFGTGRASDLLRFLRGPSGLPAAQVDWFERAVRRSRLQSAAAALELWEERTASRPAT